MALGAALPGAQHLVTAALLLACKLIRRPRYIEPQGSIPHRGVARVPRCEALRDTSRCRLFNKCHSTALCLVLVILKKSRLADREVYCRSFVVTAYNTEIASQKYFYVAFEHWH
jgi:hypothetical protein